MSQQATQQQLTRQFSKNQFIQIVSELLQSLQIQSVQTVQQIYQQLSIKNQKILGKHILQAVQFAKQDYYAKKIINSQITGFYDKIAGLMKKGITCLSVLEYYQVFGKQGLINQQLDRYIKNETYISLKKLKKVINNIEQLAYQSGRISQTLDIKMSNLAKSNIYQQTDFNSLPDIKIESIIDYIKQNIIDIGIKINVQNMLKRIQRKIYDLQQNQIIQKQVQNQLRKKYDELDYQLYQNYKILDNKDKQIDKLQNKLKQNTQQLLQITHKYQQQTLINIKILEQQNNNLTNYLKDYSIKNQQLNTKLQWFKINYQGLTKQYQQFLIQKQQNQNKQKKDKQERIFIQRTIKQQLQDAQGKVSRLRFENGQLKNKNVDVIYSYENRINQLENKIKQLEQMKGMQYLNVVSNGSSIRNSYIMNTSKWRNSKISSNITIKNSKLLNIDNQQDNKNNNNQVLKSSVQVFQQMIKSNINKNQLQILKSTGFKKKKQMISIRAMSLMTESDDDELSYSNVKQVQYQEDFKNMNKKKQVNLNKTLVGKQKQKQKDKSLLNKSVKVQKNSSNKKQQQQLKVSKIKNVLTCYGYFINLQGSKYPSYLVVSQDKFSFLDSKMRQNITVKLNQIRKIIFCYHNTSWIVIKVKSSQKNDKNQTLNDIVFDIFDRRSQVLQYLRQKCSNKLYQQGVKISFQKQDAIWIKLPDSQVLLFNYQNCYNLNRISISIADNIFQCKIKQNNSIFNFANKVILIVTNIGILTFQNDGDHLLQRNQKFLQIIPIVQLMEIQVTNQRKLILKYKTQKKYVYQIKLQNRTLMMRLKSLIQGQIKNSIENKNREMQKYELLMNVLNKNKSN